MSGVNKVIIIGHLGTDPELRTVSNGNTVARLNIATSESWTDREGQRHERTEWHRVVVWGKQAEICGKYLVKGRQVYVEGRLQTRSWEDQNNQKKYTTEIIANNVQFLGSQAGVESGAGASSYAYQTREDKKRPQGSASASSTSTASDSQLQGSGAQGTTTTSSYDSSNLTSPSKDGTSSSSSHIKNEESTFDKNEEIPF